jgi:hypothetical protein
VSVNYGNEPILLRRLRIRPEERRGKKAIQLSLKNDKTCAARYAPAASKNRNRQKNWIQRNTEACACCKMDSTARNQIERLMSVYPADVRYRNETRCLAVALRLSTVWTVMVRRVILQQPSFSSLAQLSCPFSASQGFTSRARIRIPAMAGGGQTPRTGGLANRRWGKILLPGAFGGDGWS